MIEDMSDAIALLSSGTYTVTRRAPPTNVNGYATPGATSTFTITASVQPAPGKVTELLPEGWRNRDTREAFTSTPLRTAKAGQIPDVVTIEGSPFQAYSIEPFEELGNFQAVILVREP